VTGPTAAVRALVVERDEGRCVACGRVCVPFSYSLQHRRARGMGGDKRPDTNQPQNLIVLCGHATGSHFSDGGEGCHARAERRRSEQHGHGWWIGQWEDPLEVPVTSWRGPIWLHADGTWSHVTDAGSPGVVENPFTGAVERPVF
jgi:hypothetical protein